MEFGIIGGNSVAYMRRFAFLARTPREGKNARGDGSKGNQKWYGALLTVKKDKLGLPSDERVEIVDLRAAAEYIDEKVDDKKFFRGYHMNKKYWITICLDGSVPLDEIQTMLDVSYDLARKA